jgi:hypothetical protein
MTVTALLDRLDGVRPSGDGWTALCPAHADKNASLSINVAEDERKLLYCHAGCSFDTVVSALGCTSADLGPGRDESSCPGDAAIVATYQYVDEGGRLISEVVRYEPKTFRQRRPDGNGGWYWNSNGCRRVLYHLPQVRSACQGGREIFIAEGEKDVLSLERLGFEATTSVGGAGKWRDEYTQSLAGCSGVVILPDNDEPGRTHGEMVATSVRASGVPVKIVQLPGLAPKGDVSDWIAAGGSKADLLRMVSETPTWKPIARDPVEPSLGGFHFEPIGTLLAAPEEPARWLVEGLLPSGGLSILVAKPKVGKSTLARGLALAVSRGKDFLGRKTTKGPVAYLALEEKGQEVVRHFRDLEATPADELLVHAGPAPANAVAELRRFAEEKRPVLIIVDTLFRLARVRAGQGDDYAAMTAALDPILALARETGAHTLLLHHAPKGERTATEAPLGSTAIAGSVDTVIHLKRSERYRTIETEQRVGDNLPEAVLEFDPKRRSVSLGDSKEAAEVCRLADELEEANRNCVKPAEEDEFIAEVAGATRTKRKALRQLYAEGRVERSGDGKKGSPYTYQVSRFLVPEVCRERENENPNNRENLDEQGLDSRSQDSTDLSENGPAGNEDSEWVKYEAGASSFPSCPVPESHRDSWRLSPWGVRVCLLCHPNPEAVSWKRL